MADDPTATPYYAPPPPYRRRTPARPRTAKRSDLRRRLHRRLAVAGGAVVVVVAALILGLTLASAGKPSGAKTATQAVARLLEAARGADVAKAQTALCSRDRALGEVSHLQSLGVVEKYTVGTLGSQAGFSVVDATFTTSRQPTPHTEAFPVLEQGGRWTVCFSLAIDSARSRPSTGAAVATLPVASTAPTAGQTPGNGLCAGQSSGYDVALNYMGSAEIGNPSAAAACVYRGQVSASVTAALAGQLYSPQTKDASAAVITFLASGSGSPVTVSTAREGDGKFYVIALSVGAKR